MSEEKLHQVADAVKKMLGGEEEEGGERKFSKRIKKTSSVEPLGISIPINLDVPDRGKLRCYLSLPGEIALDEDVLFAVIEKLAKYGYPLDFYNRKNESNGSGFKG